MLQRGSCDTLALLRLLPLWQSWRAKWTNAASHVVCKSSGHVQIDHTTKLLLAAIALGLWLNAGVHFIGKAHADNEDAS